tara:strand:+ start:342 stop:509 length:168 start_codon:yes stop_codon:yes gene_type:complete
MDKFDPAINYGPNDAGVSGISILLVILGFVVITWIITTIYSSIENIIKTKNEKKE